jgi:hypothetical protein
MPCKSELMVKDIQGGLSFSPRFKMRAGSLHDRHESERMDHFLAGKYNNKFRIIFRVD